MGVPHTLVVEPPEVDAYREAVKQRELLADVVELNLDYKRRYELLDGHGLTKSTGSGPARNFIWDHAKQRGARWHWVMDDNLRAIYRLHENEKHKVLSGAAFRAMEDFTLRYSNVAMSGPNYEMFVPRRDKCPPFTTNTRVYSCNLIRNDLPFRWRGRYNEDTILSLDMLKAGWCTILFNAFLADKMRTQMLGGGNTAEIYDGANKVEGQAYAVHGTTEKSRMLARVHPDCASVVWRFRRVHHHVNYGQFRRHKLIRRDAVTIPSAPDEYGLQLTTVT